MSTEPPDVGTVSVSPTTWGEQALAEERPLVDGCINISSTPGIPASTHFDFMNGEAETTISFSSINKYSLPSCASNSEMSPMITPPALYGTASYVLDSLD